MIIYSHKLANYINHKIIQQILLGPKYEIKGSFRRKATYITDIDVINTVYPNINSSNIYDKLVAIINKLKSNPNIIIGQITCGTDDRFKLEEYDIEKINKIINLINLDDKTKIESIMINNNIDNQEKLFNINEIIWSNYKPRWTIDEIFANKKILSDNSTIAFTDQLNNNSSLLIEYYVYLYGIPIGIDIFVKYAECDEYKVYASAGEYYMKLSHYKKEYYYMLFPLRLYFRDKKQIPIQTEINNIIEQTYGLYKQLLTFIQTYNHLSNLKLLTYDAARSIVKYVIYHVPKLKDVSEKSLSIIKNINLKLDSDAMNTWKNDLSVCYDSIESDLHLSAKPIYEKYLLMVDPIDINKVSYKN